MADGLLKGYWLENAAGSSGSLSVRINSAC